MNAKSFPGFDASLLVFLEQLSRNNRREWFEKNKSRYEQELLEPVQAFIRACAPGMQKISPHFVVSDKRMGGSMMRIYRDTRFSKDKSPYKLNVGIHFRHEMAKDVHAPGFYVHIEPAQCFLGAGVWHPDAQALKAIRQAIVDEPARWKRARDSRPFREHFEPAGDRLKTAPRDFDKDHPLVDDLKRKDFVGVKQVTEKELLDRKYQERVVASFKAGTAYMRFLCEALRVPF